MISTMQLYDRIGGAQVEITLNGPWAELRAVRRIIHNRGRAVWPQRLAHGQGGRVAVIGVAGQAFLQDAGQSGGDVAPPGLDRDGVFFEQGPNDVTSLTDLVVDELACQ